MRGMEGKGRRREKGGEETGMKQHGGWKAGM